MKHPSVYFSSVILAVVVSFASYKPNNVTSSSGLYEWRTLYLPHYAESYTSSSKPVLALAHGKEDYEEQFRLCAVVEGDGALMLVYGEEGEAVEFHLEWPGDICTTTFVGWGGGGRHLNQLDVYLYYYDIGTPPTLYRPEIKVGTAPSK